MSNIGSWHHDLKRTLFAFHKPLTSCIFEGPEVRVETGYAPRYVNMACDR